MMSDDKMLRLSVQGSHFVLPVSDVTRHDWLVRTMLETDLPTDRIADALYLNCDAEAFRLIIMLLCGTASMPQALERLSDLSQSIVRATAEYLLCFEVVRAIDDMVAKKMDHQAIVLDEAKLRETELRHQLQLKCAEMDEQRKAEMQEMDELKSKASFRAVMEKVLSSGISVKEYFCSAKRTHRPGNICGESVVIVGDCENPICESCSEPMRLVKKTIAIPNHEVIENIADLEGLFKRFH